MIGRKSHLMRCLHLGTTLLLLLPLITGAIINGSFHGYLFTAHDQPDSNRMTKDRAQQWCKENSNSTLLEIYDSSLRDDVVSFANSNSGQGLGKTHMFTNGIRNAITQSWQWVNGIEFPNGLTVYNQPNPDDVFGYLYQNQTGVFFTAHNVPADRRNYICEWNISSDCEFIRYSRCYRSYSTALSWYDARNECLKGGGDLASFDSVNDQQSLNSLNGSWMTANTPYWIGLRRQWWTWQQSNSEIKYTDFQDGHPNPIDNCLCVLSRGDSYKWSDCGCSQTYQFICMRKEYSANSSASTTTTQSSSASQSPPSSAKFTNPLPSSAGNRDTKPDDKKAMRMGVGIGVGVGGSLIIIVVIVVVVLLIRRRRQKEPENSQNQRRLKTPDIISEQQDPSPYAEIHRTYNDDEMETNKTKDKTNIVYSDLRITDPA